MFSVRSGVVGGVRCPCVCRGWFFYWFSVRPKGIKEAKGLVGEIRLDPVMFIASMLKSIISIGVWSSVVFLLFFGSPKRN